MKTTMNKTMKHALLVCLLSTLTIGVAGQAGAQGTTIDAAPVKALFAPPGYKGPVSYDGRVMVVNRNERSITVDIEGKLHLFKVTPQVKILRNGKQVNLMDIVAGQKVSLVARSLDNGTLELVSLGLTPADAANEPAGSKGKGPDGRGGGNGPSAKAGTSPGNSLTPPPFQNGNYPGNVERVIVSPN
jgi:hypothetical protein